ncbi:MAG: helix-turn-helix domain-containing protein [Acidobacteriota bacterium]|nr:MAG: helix-turn-helix domain-containing protein [Acidobacteriota bacterium]
MERLLQQNRHLWDLLEAIVLLKDSQEAGRFFRDLCTPTELETLAERWLVVRMLEQKLPYRQISRETGASTATVTRVAHWLKRGDGGYRLMLDRLEEGICGDGPLDEDREDEAQR